MKPTTRLQGAPSDSLSRASQGLASALAVAYALFGAVLFVAPAWSSARFPWNVSPFVTMTIGGWCLGNAWIAWRVARDPSWSRGFGLLAYLWLFGILQAAVVIWFRDLIATRSCAGGGFSRLIPTAAATPPTNCTVHVLTWPYLACIGLTAVFAIFGVTELVRVRPSIRGTPTPGWIQPLVWVFVVGVGSIAAVAFLRPSSGATMRVFPERLSHFTLRAFGAFYASLALSALVLAFAGSERAVLAYAVGGLGLIPPITIAALVYLPVFHFSAHPLQFAYIGAYVLVFVVTAWAVIRDKGRGADTAA
jgi:hypothetical protein